MRLLSLPLPTMAFPTCSKYVPPLYAVFLHFPMFLLSFPLLTITFPSFSPDFMSFFLLHFSLHFLRFTLFSCIFPCFYSHFLSTPSYFLHFHSIFYDFYDLILQYSASGPRGNQYPTVSQLPSGTYPGKTLKVSTLLPT